MNNFINKKLIVFNAFSTVIQVVFTGITYFFLYKILLNKLGASLLGVWSIVIVTTSLANLGNLGITSGLVKFIAELTKLNDREKLHRLLFTAFFSTFFLYLFFCLLFLLASNFILHSAIENKYLIISKQLLPYSLFSLFINGCSGVFSSVLDGFQKNYSKNLILIAGNIILFAATYLFINTRGIFAIAIAQNIQVVFVLGCNILFTFYFIGHQYFLRWNWDSKVFKKISLFGLKLQMASIAQMLCEPTTKILLGKYSGLTSVGYYEMATRLVSQIRAVLSNANQIIVPIVSNVDSKNLNEISYIYKKSFSLILVLGIIAFSSSIILSVAISQLWIGAFNEIFVMSLILLSFSNLINTLCGPAYFSFLGKGKLNPILSTHILIGVLNLLLGVVFGKLIPQYGVVIGWCFSLALGSIYLIYLFQKQYHIFLSESFNRQNIVLIIILFAIGFFFYFSSKPINNLITMRNMLILSVLVFSGFILISLFLNKTIIKSILKLSINKK